ncbi:MAG: DUF5683 domain-containing protein [Balneolales bacterium]|nr:DUF5683 domain-containing protein [Balneolales bacterium]
MRVFQLQRTRQSYFVQFFNSLSWSCTLRLVAAAFLMSGILSIDSALAQDSGYVSAAPTQATEISLPSARISLFESKVNERHYLGKSLRKTGSHHLGAQGLQRTLDLNAAEPGVRYSISDSESLRSTERDTVPDPRIVLRQSMVLPGWGQYTNRQAWKIPIIYGMMGGLAYYAYFADNRYRGYRAAFYNSVPENTDLRFGTTPDWIPQGASPEFLRSTRNFYRNRRDFIIIATVLSYGLNILDAYIFAHMRDFDVSDDLSAISIQGGANLVSAPGSGMVPSIRLNLRF